MPAGSLFNGIKTASDIKLFAMISLNFLEATDLNRPFSRE